MEDIADSQMALRLHLGLGERDGVPNSSPPPEIAPLFFVERAPPSSRAARCKLASCNDSIETGQYRIALTPAMNFYGSKSVNFYHVACFEKIADLSKADFLDRIEPVIRSTWPARNLSIMSILDGNYLCHGAVERLVLEWKVQEGRWIDESEGKEIKSLQESLPELNELLHMAGSSNFKAPGLVSGMTLRENLLFLTTLAPFESDGPEDTNEWNLFETFLSKDQESWHDPHDLSKMLTKWEKYRKLATYKDDALSEHEKELKAEIGDKGIRAIKRLSNIPMLNL